MVILRQQQGNVLFLILIAVALFAALSYAVTKSTSGGGNANKETALLDAASLTQFGAGISTAIMRMKINGTHETDLCFYSGSNHADYNHASCSNDDNNIFHSSGGGISYQTVPSGLNDGSEWEFTASIGVTGLGIDGGNPGTDLVMILRDITLDICNSINDNIGVTGIPVDSGDIDVNRFDGDYTVVDGLDGCPSNCATVALSPFGSIGANTGCFEEGATGDYIYFHTLLIR